ncbi:host cell division inhibitor Icd-like protein [Citrobacter sp. HN-141]|uniref:host cell division inhibitor Icd-like protein n=1 Tax=unclassified Citrobacter TaxID=2644389 RepID=UPI002964D544|nr:MULTISPECIES: host cell division inhibitor Icd-like protein [unclassified Citrobacter]MDW2645998.1 host cell division inhibitor Icd-like protein [Citrobacter sp. HN-141]MDW2655504.1 host cell division inhibitor Icd-like protein [Citrobacter sp. HN-120]MDW2698529.1 host cell division inhibitor Icd-like protein [Citrobacter sp. HN-144]
MSARRQKKSTGRGNLFIFKATQTPLASFFVAALAHTFSGPAPQCIMVALAGQLSGWPGSLKTGISTPVSVTTRSERGNSWWWQVLLLQGDQHMLATPTQTHPKYIWLIAAVRRDCKILSAKIHHIPAETEREARHFLLREHVCFFAGRIVRGE